MIKRIVLLWILVSCFYAFYFLIPYKIVSHSPILVSLIFSLITVILIVLAIFNIGSLSEWKLFRQRTMKLHSFWTGLYVVATISFTGLFFVYLLNFLDIIQNELDTHSKETKGVIVGKWTEKIITGLKSYSFTHIKVKYNADKREIISEHITGPGFMVTIPDSGQTVKIFYTTSNPGEI